MAGHGWEDWFEREEFIGQISDMRVQNLQVEREVVQKRTFTRWINLHLEKCNPPIEVHDLFQDIQDGHVLMALLEELSGCKLLHGFKKSSHRIFRLNNIAKVLSFLEERNVKLVSIDAADVADGNSSIILGLIWNIILFFQIKELTGNIRSQFPSSTSLSSIPTSSDSDTSFCSMPSDERQSASTAMREHSKAIKKLLQWVQKRTRKFGVAVHDFGKSWTSGLAFLAVIKSIDPSLVDMRKALLRTARENLEDAFRIAHYSLGIPRLLEPEDVTINAPDEQSIMTYVSQFLEHFPGIEEPEQPSQLIERSISMCRLNFHENDSDQRGNSSHRSRVRVKSYMFQKGCVQPQPKILISSVSEDRSTMSPPFRPAAARSWSSEDILVDPPHMEDTSRSVVEEPKETASEVLGEVLVNSTSNSPQLSYTHSLTGSSVPESANSESVIDDSAISSPDSWVESEFGVMPEKFCESRSDSSLCDSGTAWEVYRATPVEITTLDEGFVPSIEDRASDEQSVTESCVDEGIYSLSSLESNQERIQGHSLKKQAEEVRKKEANPESLNQNISSEQIPDPRETETTKDINSKQVDTSSLQNNQVTRDSEELPNPGVKDLLEPEKNNYNQLICDKGLPPANHLEELIKQTITEESTIPESVSLKEVVDFTGDGENHEGQIIRAESQNKRKNSVESEVETECKKTDSLSEEIKEVSGILKKRDELVEKTQDKAREGVLREYLDPQESLSSETCDALADTNVTNQDKASKFSLDPGSGINIPLISMSSELDERNEESTCDSGRQDHAEGDNVHEAEATENKRTDTDVDSPQNPDELSCNSSDRNDRNPVEISVCQASENVKTTSEQMRDTKSGHLTDTDKSELRLSNADICGPDMIENMEGRKSKQECELPQHNSQTQDFISQKSSTDAKSQPVNTGQNLDLTNQLDGQKDKLGSTFSNNEKAVTQQNTLDPVNSKHNGTTGNSCYEEVTVSRDMASFYIDFDRSSPTDDLVGDPVEPMDLFYPDKEEPMFAEPPDIDMQSWPSVLSVSALQPAPASETLPDDQPLKLADEENDKVKVITNTNWTDKASESQEHHLLPQEKKEELWGGVVLADSSDLSKAEPHSSDSAGEKTEPVRSDNKSFGRQDKGQIPPVLRHRKGLRLTENMDNQTTVTRKADNGDSEFWCSESGELYLLLLLWLLLYCFWLLPQMDLKSLPSLLLNVNH